MSTEIKSPTFPESVVDGTVANWLKREGEKVKQDEVIAEIETDKVVLEVVAPFDGSISKIYKQAGETVVSAELIADFSATTDSSKAVEEKTPVESIKSRANKNKSGPAAKRILSNKEIDAEEVAATGKGGRITKADVIAHLERTESQSVTPENLLVTEQDGRHVERVPMSRLRATIAKRLLEAKQGTAMLTTFNEVDMLPIKNMRAKFGAEFELKHGVKLGFMSFFVAAAVDALRAFPSVNASLDGNDIVYHSYQDIGVAVSSERGLVVPILRNAENLDLAEIEKSIIDYSQKARDGKLEIQDMQGGTFTISNGGVFGSLLSTPILNAPQTAILGMHKIQDRAVVVNGEITIRPMMYLALSYDHRLIDGKEAVGFLVNIKEALELPERLLLGL
ncbi:MAG: 2-oxoglutarate dehydrogenase complex dihydrolipoyllysine-residue succinyltransferase [Gammaproteobacteria bacterium]